MRKRISLYISLLTIVLAQPSVSHHGFLLYFDPSDQVEIQGVLVEAKIRNPHSELLVEVATGSGVSEIWTCETQALTILMRKGYVPQDFMVGEVVRVSGARGRHKANSCQTSSIELADGRVIEVRSAAGVAAINIDDQVEALQELSIFGRWIRNVFVGEPAEEGFLNKITQAGRIANANYDPFTEDPPLLCRPGSPPRAWVAPGQPTEIRQEGDRILIQHEFLDFTRTIHMNGTGRPDLANPSEMGYSVGRLQDESLTVTTSRFAESTLLTHVGESGLMHSDEMILTETYKVNSDSGELEYRWSAEDPKYFSAPITGGFSLTPTMQEIVPFNCEILINLEG